MFKVFIYHFDGWNETQNCNSEDEALQLATDDKDCIYAAIFQFVDGLTYLFPKLIKGDDFKPAGAVAHRAAVEYGQANLQIGPLTKERAIEVLTAVKRKYGKAYKINIREAWQRGNYSQLGLAEWQTELQQIRNQWGPRWLERNKGN